MANETETAVRQRHSTGIKRWELSPEPATFASSNKWSNSDMDVVPEHKRTWGTLVWCYYWLSDALNVASYELASSMLAVGLSWRQALPAIAVGHIIIACAITANGTIGARLHVPFPVLNRSSFGFYFSYFSVVSRLILGMFWFGIQTYTGSECVYQMLKAIWPSTANIPNRLPESSHITTTGLMCYFLFWLLQFPFLLISPQKVRWLFLAKAVIVPPAFLAMMIWAFATTGGGGEIFRQEGSLSGSKLGWAWMAALNSTLGNFCKTQAVNIPDFTRYAPNPRSQYIQLIIIPIAFTFCAFVGIACTSAGYVHYGVYYWDPLRLIDNWDNRAASFFASFAFALATICTNISANSISAANDFTALLPRWVNIRRGQILCALIGGWVILPWEILATAIGFLQFMAGYTVFLGPIAGIMIADYYIVKHQAIDVPALYKPHGRYRYHGGVNWRALAALIVSVPPNLPGLINAINPAIDVGGGIYPYNIAWLLGFTLAAGVYSITSFVWPAQGTNIPHTLHDEAHPAPRDGSQEGSIGEEEKKKDNATGKQV
ncbi:hypothetical protein M408DRAFT_325742 [Serendipita vermifera MAFF 305830]|uniref:NCS1 nucleoside transporter family n=1 Tax=Serendipita vermifera MAFF 305830 TaxID=933852 RepID=A0A0C2XZM3_SERVB|nr:hypothetical protein M408DRAFT_325742 [Serendipita vermifera MAFF 305830]